ncbi:MAG: leucine-rich repeat domain-containing protein [Lentimicrobiaceae bacterium]|nr:leucine-rich repeat domain-containing protein [Lentimicrobiaceae bacterium]
MKKIFLLFLTVLYFCAFISKAMGQTVNYGNIGHNGAPVTASLYQTDSTLTITGTGNMADFLSSTEWDGQSPWKQQGHCSKIRTVIINNGVMNIGDVAFQDCNNLKWISIPEGVTIIGVKAFENCTSLQVIYIPSSVNSIENQAFINCSNLKVIGNMATAPQNINSTVFQNVPLSGKYLAVPVQSVEIYQSANIWGSSFNVTGLFLRL